MLLTFVRVLYFTKNFIFVTSLVKIIVGKMVSQAVKVFWSIRRLLSYPRLQNPTLEQNAMRHILKTPWSFLTVFSKVIVFLDKKLAKMTIARSRKIININRTPVFYRCRLGSQNPSYSNFSSKWTLVMYQDSCFNFFIM